MAFQDTTVQRNHPPQGIQCRPSVKYGMNALPRIPNFASEEEEQQYCKEHLVGAFRVFGDAGFDDGGTGHISLRDPVHPEHFWINPYGMHFADIRVSDLLLVNKDAEVIQGDHAVNAAGFLVHSEIFKAHPWINAICHAHSIYGRAYSVFGKELPPLTQDSLRFYETHSVLREYHGVVLSAEEGKSIAAVLRPQDKVCILQNHGLLSIGKTIDEAAYWFTCFEKCCQSQLAIDGAVQSNEPSHQPIMIDHETARSTQEKIGTRQGGWMNFQPSYTHMLKKTNGEFLQ